MTPAETLANSLDALDDAGRSWPCRGRDEWISEDPSERADAADACKHCPVLDLCDAVARAKPRPTHGVWAGRDVTPRPRKKAA